LPVVSNTSPLIWLSKIGKITLLKELYNEVMIPDEVYKEAVEKGLEEGFSDALIIKESVSQGWIRVTDLNEKEAELCQKIVEQASEIHLGEAQAIILARERNTLLLMDESSGRAFAETWGIRVRGTLYLITKALGEGILSKDEAKEATLQLVAKGFRIEPRLLARVLREIGNSSPK